MMMDNGALSIGPQIVIDKTQVEPENGSWKMTPRKVWKKSGGDLGTNNEPFRTYNIQMNQAQIAGIIELAIRFTDEVVSMPTISEGEQGAHGLGVGGEAGAHVVVDSNGCGDRLQVFLENGLHRLWAHGCV